jgi:hypothetical protein
MGCVSGGLALSLAHCRVLAVAVTLVLVKWHLDIVFGALRLRTRDTSQWHQRSALPAVVSTRAHLGAGLGQRWDQASRFRVGVGAAASVLSVPQPPQIFQPVHRGASERPCDCVVSHVCPWRSWQ